MSCNDYPMLWDKGPGAERRRAAARARSAATRSAPSRPSPRARSRSSRVAGYRSASPGRSRARSTSRRRRRGPRRPTMPTLVISGELDNVTSPGEGRAVAARLRRRPPADRPQRRPRPLALRRPLPGPRLGPALRRPPRVAAHAPPPARPVIVWSRSSLRWRGLWSFRSPSRRSVVVVDVVTLVEVVMWWSSAVVGVLVLVSVPVTKTLSVGGSATISASATPSPAASATSAISAEARALGPRRRRRRRGRGVRSGGGCRRDPSLRSRRWVRERASPARW